jgi:acyloxyacyl hydrolase
VQWSVRAFRLVKLTQTIQTVNGFRAAGAHFHIPPEWVTAKDINSTTFKNIVDILMNELDWPQMGASTGYEATNWVGAPDGTISSLYLQARKQNLCSHRDYQCIAVNGMRSSVMPTLAKSLARNQTTDRPVLLTYALVGNGTL